VNLVELKDAGALSKKVSSSARFIEVSIGRCVVVVRPGFDSKLFSVVCGLLGELC
jgi:hypothetical protein